MDAVVGYLRLALGDVLLPGLLAATSVAAAAGLARRGAPRRLVDVLAAAGVVGGFALGLGRIAGWPALPLAPGTDAWRWTAWIAPASLLATAAWLARPLPRPATVLLGLGLGLGAGWLLVSPYVPQALARTPALLQAAATALFALLLAGALRARPGPAPRAAPTAVPVIVALSALAGVLAFVAGAAVLGRVAGVLAAVVGAAWATAMLLGGPPPLRAAAWPVALLLASIVLSAWQALNYPGNDGFPLGAVLGIALGALLGAGAAALLARRGHPAAATLVGGLLAALGGVVAVLAAQAGAPPPNPYAG